MGSALPVMVKGVSPRAGGEADKFGGRFEARWTVRWMLDVLAGRAQSIVVEERGEDGGGIEFTVTDKAGQADSHQVKRQRGNRNGWSLRELGIEGVLDAAAAQVRAGRRFWFVSLVPARDLDELCDQARRSDDVEALRGSLSKELDAKFAVLAERWGGDPQAFEILRKIYVEWPSESYLRAPPTPSWPSCCSTAPPVRRRRPRSHRWPPNSSGARSTRRRSPRHWSTTS